MLAYHVAADRTLDQLMEQLDELGDATDVPGYDATFSVRPLASCFTHKNQQQLLTLPWSFPGVYVHRTVW